MLFYWNLRIYGSYKLMEAETTELKHFNMLCVANIVPDLELSPLCMSFFPISLFSFIT